jgi:DNA-binding response OmpR family regulator
MGSTGKILIIDGEESIRTFLSLWLADEGYEYQTATDTTAGLNYLSTFSPDIILLDMRSPFHNEKQFLKTYPAILGRHIPVIGLSTSRHFEEMAGQLGIPVCLAKPFDLGELLVCIKQHM